MNHPDEFITVMMEKENCKRTDLVQNAETKRKDNKKAKLDLMDACVRLVTIHGRPFSLTDDNAFRDIINMIPSQTEE